MIELLRGFHENAAKFGKKPLMYDRDGGRKISYAEADDMSGRVAAWLRDKGIGKEDTVAVFMPRCSEFILAELGILKAGAAFVPIDWHIPEARSSYIIQNAGCRAVITQEIFAEAQEYKPLPADKWADPGPHDLAFVVYTSGSTGAPKGIMQEYGVIDTFLEGVQDLISGRITESYDRVYSAIVSPFMFTATIFLRLALCYYGAPMHVISEEMLKNGTKLVAYFIFRRIKLTFMTPSLIKTLDKIPGLSLKFVILGGEVVHEVYSKKYYVVNGYAMGEAGTLVSYFIIDKLYESTPVGKPLPYMKTKLLAEDGSVSEKEGVLCLRLPYFRGYLGLEETTQKSFKEIDGEKYFVTGDRVVAEDGVMTILGRTGEMVKINGNRVEIGEVEAAILRTFPKVQEVAVRAYDDKNSASKYLVAFFRSGQEITADKFKEVLSREITSYMMPRYFVQVEAFPKTTTGKIDKKQLRSPEAAAMRGEYVAPITPMQDKVCKAFASAMNLDVVGIKDDIVEMGADSLVLMSVVAELNLPGIEVTDILAARTPEKLAETAESKKELAKIYSDENLKKEMAAEHTLTDFQRFFFDYQLYTPLSTMYNLCTLFKFPADAVDADLLANAMGESIKTHNALLTKIFIDDDGDFKQRYSEDAFTPVEVIDTDEASFQKMKDSLVKPFRLVNSPLYRAAIYRTEEAVHMFFDVHHMLFDGTSYHVFLKDVFMAYMGQPLATDYYFCRLGQLEEYRGSQKEWEDAKFLQSLYPAEEVVWNTRPAYDFASRDNKIGENVCELPVSLAALEEAAGKYKVGKSGIIAAAIAVALYAYNGNPDISFIWTYSNRSSSEQANMVGLLICDLPFVFRLKECGTIEDLISKVREQTMGGMAHSGVFIHKNDRAVLDDSVCLLYQSGIYDAEGGDLPIKIEEEELTGYDAAENALDFEFLEKKDSLELLTYFNASLYKEESILRFRGMFEKALEIIAADASASIEDAAGKIK